MSYLFKARRTFGEFSIAVVFLTSACASDGSRGSEDAKEPSTQDEESDTSSASDEQADSDDTEQTPDPPSEGEGDGDSASEGDDGESASCPDRSHALLGGGRSFGFCGEDCTFDLSFEAAGAEGECGSYGAQVALKDNLNRDVLARYRAELTDAAWAESARLGLALDQQTLETRYGCPDCADGGRGWLTTRVIDDGVRHDYEWHNPPALFVEAHAFIQELITQIHHCQGGAWVAACTEIAP